MIYNGFVSKPILVTKLFIPAPQQKIVLCTHLIEWLNDESLHNRIFISAPAGFWKTTLVSEWGASCQRPIAWVSLDNGDMILYAF
jgi:LuxR family maltose regulon positive regulatory protein